MVIHATNLAQAQTPMTAMLYDAYNVSKFQHSAPLEYHVSGGNFGPVFRLENAEGGSEVNVGDIVNVWMGNSQMWAGMEFVGWSSDALVLYNGSVAMMFSAGPILADGTSVMLTASAYDLASPPPCYLAGTQVETAEGMVAVEDLTEGALLKTLSGDFAPLLWVGRRTVSDRMIAQAAGKSLPIRFAAGSLGGGLPARTLFVSPDHCLYHDGSLIPARRLVNGTSVTQGHPGREIIYFHLLLEGHQVIFAEGVAAESFLPSGNIFGFHNGETFPEAASVAKSCFPVRFSGRAVAALQAQIAACDATCDRDTAKAA